MLAFVPVLQCTYENELLSLIEGRRTRSRIAEEQEHKRAELIDCDVGVMPSFIKINFGNNLIPVPGINGSIAISKLASE